MAFLAKDQTEPENGGTSCAARETQQFSVPLDGRPIEPEQNGAFMSPQSKEQQILVVMRKVLAAIIKDTTPEPGTRHTLTDRTIQDIRQCLALIAAREKELADAEGRGGERPYYADQPQKSTVVPIGRIGKGKKETPTDES